MENDQKATTAPPVQNTGSVHKFVSRERVSPHQTKYRCGTSASGSDVLREANHRLQSDTPRALSVPNNLHTHQRHFHRHHHAHLPPCQQEFESYQPLSNRASASFLAESQYNRQWSPQMRTKWLTNQWASAVVIVLALASLGVAQAFTCPPVNLIHRLTAANGAPINRHAQNQTPECDCTVIQEGGWEINCYASSNENENEPFKSKWSPPKDFDSPDYMNIDYNILTVSFSIRYVMGRQVKITCDHGTPVFKPALFQGFGLEMIDTFIISNCELPLTLPLSVILYRTTPKHVFTITSKLGDSSYAINTTDAGNSDLVSPIRALYLTSSKAITIQQLNTLLSDLESLEQLTLNDFNLSDVDDYLVESIDHHQFTNHSRRRVSRDINETEVETSSSLIETTTIVNRNGRANDVEVTTFIPEFAKELALEMSTLPSLPLEVGKLTNTSTPDKNVSTTIETTTRAPIINMTEFVDANSTKLETSDIPAEEESNDVNVENKPIAALDESALNFARTLPNIRILRLRHFIKESTIPNVLFQIIRGLSKLEYLELDSNTISQIPSNALSFAGDSLKKLYMYKNSIKEISEDAFTNLTRLEILDLSQNQVNQLEDYTLKPLKSLLYLSLRNNEIQTLSEYTLQTNSKLMSLDLSQNRNLEPLPANLFSGLSSLANLSLAHCNMSQVSPQIQQLFRNVPNLSRLDLKGNQITNLTLNGLFAWNSKLSKLELSSNKISQISGNIFSTNSSQLMELNLNRNKLTELPDGLFINARNLHKLSVAGNELRETSPMMFIHLRSLEELDLSRNKITTLNTHVNQLPFGIGGALKKVDLSFNNLTNFDVEINGVNWHLYLLLSELNLKNNQFNGTLSVPIFSSSIEPVIDLDLSSNKFTSIEVKHLLVDWSFKLTEDAFSDTSSTNTQSWETQVRLDNNPINCNCFLFPFLNYTKTMGHLFSKNSHSIVRKTVFVMDAVESGLTCHQPDDLKDRDLSQLQLDELVCRINETRICPEQCSCLYRSVDQAAIIDCDNSDLEQLPSQFQLSRYFNISVQESNSAIREVNSVVLQLRNNSIESIRDLPAMYDWPHVDMKAPSYLEIWLDNNNISVLEEDIVPPVVPNGAESSMPLLRIFSLSHNNIKYVPIQLLKNFEMQAESHLGPNSTYSVRGMGRRRRLIESKIHLGINPIDCYNDPMPPGSDCYIRDFKAWLSLNRDRVADINSIQCDPLSLDMLALNGSNTNLVILNMTDNLLCPVQIPPPDNGPILALSIICIILASSLFVVSVLYYRNKQTILAFIYIHLNPIFICLSFTEHDLDEDKLYDAFVSYSSSDRDIVMELIEKLEKPHDMSEANLMLQNGSTIQEGKIDQIVPENEFKKSNSGKGMDLENAQDGQTRYRLCIHERDWLPGNLISWNIVNSVQNSKRTILVLSQSFIQSIWFQVEFHTAYYQMLEDKMDRLIVIVRGELPPKEQMDKDLIFLLTSKTYLVWGEKWFWEKLYYAMPHKKKQSVTQFGKEMKYDHKKIANGKNGALGGAIGASAHKNGILKWSSKGAQSEAMKDYVDKTIASHFQLNVLQPTTEQPQTNGAVDRKPAPKSLRNSGTLSNVTPTTRQTFSDNNGRSAAYDNKSFINETNT